MAAHIVPDCPTSAQSPLSAREGVGLKGGLKVFRLKDLTVHKIIKTDTVTTLSLYIEGAPGLGCTFEPAVNQADQQLLTGG